MTNKMFESFYDDDHVISIDKIDTFLQTIPEGQDYLTFHRRALEEFTRRQQLPAIRARANAAALEYYKAVDATLEKHGGVTVWAKPIVEALGYPTGYIVWHEDKRWEQRGPEPTVVEPGTEDDDVWLALPDFKAPPPPPAEPAAAEPGTPEHDEDPEPDEDLGGQPR